MPDASTTIDTTIDVDDNLIFELDDIDEDNEEVFEIQLNGRRRWRHYDKRLTTIYDKMSNPFSLVNQT